MYALAEWTRRRGQRVEVDYGYWSGTRLEMEGLLWLG